MTIKENTIKKYKKQISEVKSANKMEREGLKDKECDLKDKMVEMEINAKVVECDLTNYETLKTHQKTAFEAFMVKFCQKNLSKILGRTKKTPRTYTRARS